MSETTVFRQDDLAEMGDRLHFLHRLADCAASITTAGFRAGLTVDDKGPGAFDPVTAADRDAEAAMRAAITAEYPGDGICGEEYGDERLNARHRFILDPIDGTRAYIAGLPTWGTLIGLSRDGAPWLGVMDQPVLGERFWGSGAEAFWRRGVETRALATRRGVALDAAILAATSPDMFGAGVEADAFDRLSRATRLTRFGADCYAYCMLSAGFIDIVCEASLKPFDIAPLMPIIAGAGGVVTAWDGGPAGGGGRVLAAGSPELHAQAMAVLNSPA